MRHCAVIFAGALLASSLSTGTADADDSAVVSADIRARTISRFAVGSDQARFGPLVFNGGLDMTSRLSHFGALSSIRFTDAGMHFIGVADTGFWYRGVMERDEDGRPKGVSGFQMKPIPDTRGAYSNAKWETDAEGIAVGPDGGLTVSFERRHRVSTYSAPGERFDPVYQQDLDFVVPARELRSNRGFETITYAPAGGTLAGARVAITEKSIDKAGNIFAAVLEGPLKGIFKIARSDGFDITDGDFLPDGDLLILERRFTMAESVSMRIRRIAGADIKPGATVDGDVWLTADLLYQIDNMEGLDVWQNDAGETFLSLVSDDNHSLLQRNLYLEFKLVE